MRESGDWSRATSLHLLLLYEFLHREVYGAEPLEVQVPKVRALAVRQAANLVDLYFEGDPGAAAGFVLWVWRREESREAWRRENNREGGRIGWRLQFSPQLVTDYRVDAGRKGR